MTAKQLEERIIRTKAAIDKIEQRINWLFKKVDYRRRRIRELGQKRSEALNLKLDLR